MDAAYWSHVWMGIGVLSPWNAFISAADYWASKFPKDWHTERLITAAYLPPNGIFLILFIVLRDKMSHKLRIRTGFGVFTLAMGMMPIINAFPATWSFGLMLMLVALCGIADGAAQGALFGEAVCLHPKYTQPLVFGTSISGLVVSLLRIVFKLSLPETPAGLRISSDVYFLAGSFVCALCIPLHAMIPRFHDLKKAENEMIHRQMVSISSDTFGNNESSSATTVAADTIPSAQQELQLEEQNFGEETIGLMDGVQNVHEHYQSTPSISEVAWALRFPAVSMVMIYWITLAIFPGVLAEDVASEKLGSMYSVVLIALFNFFDCVGKFLPIISIFQIVNQKLLVTLSFSRILFIPAFHLAGKSNTV